MKNVVLLLKIIISVEYVMKIKAVKNILKKRIKNLKKNVFFLFKHEIVLHVQNNKK